MRPVRRFDPFALPASRAAGTISGGEVVGDY